MHRTHSRISGEWKRNKRKHSPFCSGRAVRLPPYQNSQCSSEGFVLHWTISSPSSSFQVYLTVSGFYIFFSVVQRYCGKLIVHLSGSMSAEGFQVPSQRPLKLNFGGTNGRSSERWLVDPCQRRIIALMDLLLKAGWEMPAPQEAGCKQQTNTAGGLRVGQQPLMHVHNQA